MSNFKQNNYNFMNNFVLTVYNYGLPSFFGSWLLGFIIPIAPFLGFTIALVVADLYTGVKAARKKGEKIHSKGLRRTIEKIGVYIVVILLSEGMMKVFSIPIINVTYTASFIIAIAEFKSVIENVEVVTEVNIWTKLQEKTKGLFK